MSEEQAVKKVEADKPAGDLGPIVSKQKESKPAPEIHIRVEFCKGCDICVDACPKNCLALKKGKIVVVDAESCTGCGLCELRCPDFAIWIGEIEE
jgi:2-oxoglutarate ferredoxin oxidoreductase subunit delta